MPTVKLKGETTRGEFRVSRRWTPGQMDTPPPTVVPGQRLCPGQELARAGEHLVGVGRQPVVAVDKQAAVRVALGNHHTATAAMPVAVPMVVTVAVAVAVPVAVVGARVVAGRLGSRGCLLGLLLAAAVRAHQVAEHPSWSRTAQASRRAVLDADVIEMEIHHCCDLPEFRRRSATRTALAPAW